MSPLPIPSSLASVESWTSFLDHQHLLKAILLFSLFALAFRSIVILVQKKRKMARSSLSREDSLLDQEKDTTTKQRKDSSHDEEVRLPTNSENDPVVNQRKLPGTEGWEENVPRRPSLGKEPNQYLQSLKEETIQPSLLPIYPWIAPPQPLPGPYDAPYYPLPLPTVRPEKTMNIENHAPTVKLEEVSNDAPEELESISYTRHVSTNSTPDRESRLEGAVTVSTKGWRRIQWTVTAD
jgi:hypothetical protein